MNGQSLVFGQYYPVESALHKLDARIKLVLVLGITSVLFLIDNLPVMAAVGVLVPLLAAVAKVPFGRVICGLRPLILILLLTFAIHAIVTPGEPLAAIGPISIAAVGLRNGIFFSLRISFVMLFFSLLTFTTTPMQLTDAIESLFGSLKKLRLPVHEVALMMTIAIRFIPTFIAEAETITKAQKARGADFETGNIFKRVRSFAPLLIPLFIIAFRRAEELAPAMEARGYAGGEGRTRLHVMKIAGVDIAWLIGGLLVIILVGGLHWAV